MTPTLLLAFHTDDLREMSLWVKAAVMSQQRRLSSRRSCLLQLDATKRIKDENSSTSERCPTGTQSRSTEQNKLQSIMQQRAHPGVSLARKVLTKLLPWGAKLC